MKGNMKLHIKLFSIACLYVCTTYAQWPVDNYVPGIGSAFGTNTYSGISTWGLAMLAGIDVPGYDILQGHKSYIRVAEVGLTLYIIELSKQNEKLTRDIEELKKEFER